NVPAFAVRLPVRDPVNTPVAYILPRLSVGVPLCRSIFLQEKFNVPDAVVDAVPCIAEKTLAPLIIISPLVELIVVLPDPLLFPINVPSLNVRPLCIIVKVAAFGAFVYAFMPI